MNFRTAYLIVKSEVQEFRHRVLPVFLRRLGLTVLGLIAGSLLGCLVVIAAERFFEIANFGTYAYLIIAAVVLTAFGTYSDLRK